MFSILLYSVLLGSLGATVPEKLKWSDSKFVFNGKTDEFVVVETPHASLLSWAEQRYHYFYSSILSIGTWIKSEQHEDTVVQYLVELEQLYQVVLVNGTLGYNHWDRERGNATSSVCFGDYDLKDWNLILIQIFYQTMSLSVRPLDRTTPFQTLECKEADFKIEISPQGAREIWLGSGFVGQMTPVFVDIVEYVHQFQETKACLVTDDITNCRRRLNRGHDTYLRKIQFSLDPASSIRREIDTEIRVLFNSGFTCKDGKVDISLHASQFNISTPTYVTRARYYDKYGHRFYKNVYNYPANVTLGAGESACNLTWDIDAGRLALEDPMPLTSCGFTARKMNKSSTLYSNTLYIHRAEGRTQLMDVECWYTPPAQLVEEISLAAYAVQHLQLSTSHTITPWNMSLQLYNDGNFTQRLQNPVILLKEQEVFVEGNVTYSDVVSVALVMDSCKTRVSLNHHMTLEKVLIEGALPVAPDVRFLNSTSTSSKRFVFKSTVFEEFPNAMVYLTCVMKAEEINVKDIVA